MCCILIAHCIAVAKLAQSIVIYYQGDITVFYQYKLLALRFLMINAGSGRNVVVNGGYLK